MAVVYFDLKTASDDSLLLTLPAVLLIFPRETDPRPLPDALFLLLEIKKMPQVDTKIAQIVPNSATIAKKWKNEIENSFFLF